MTARRRLALAAAAVAIAFTMWGAVVVAGRVLLYLSAHATQVSNVALVVFLLLAAVLWFVQAQARTSDGSAD